MRTLLLLLCALGLTSTGVRAQTVYNESDFKSTPVWIKMMDDENVNYYQAVLAYETFWKDRVKPEGDDDLKGSHQSRKEKRDQEKFEKQLQKMKPAERNAYDQLIYQNKRFEDWMHQAKPYVQDNGHVLTQQERVELWKKQQAEIKLQIKTTK